MSKVMPSYEERMRNPGLEIINFSYLTTHPEATVEVWNKYWIDLAFRSNVNQKMAMDPIFKKKFQSYFHHFIEKSSLSSDNNDLSKHR